MLTGCSCNQLRMMLADNFLWYNKIEWRIRILWCKNLLLGTCFVYVIICLWICCIYVIFCTYLAMNLFCQFVGNYIGWELLSIGNFFCWFQFVGNLFCFEQAGITCYVLGRNVYRRKFFLKKKNFFHTHSWPTHNL